MARYEYSNASSSCGSSCEDDEERLLATSDTERFPASATSQNKRLMGVSFGAVCFAAFALVTVLRGGNHAAKSAAPLSLTVRSLMESDELTDLATDNIIALGGSHSTSRPEVRSLVSLGLQNISLAISKTIPDAHAKMESLKLDDAQKDSAFRVLRTYGDPRMVHISHLITNVASEHGRASGDNEALKRRLTESLLPNIVELQQLSNEMDPKQKIATGVPALDKWHPEIQVDMSRRLSSVRANDVDRSVRLQAHTVLKSLEGELGDEMPRAPARMLSLFDDDSSSSSSSSSDSGGEVSFMTCLQKALPNPIGVCKCFTSNMGEVMSMLSGIMKTKT